MMAGEGGVALSTDDLIHFAGCDRHCAVETRRLLETPVTRIYHSRKKEVTYAFDIDDTDLRSADSCRASFWRCATGMSMDHKAWRVGPRASFIRRAMRRLGAI